MNSQQKGAKFEKITEDFFLFLFNEIQIQVNNHWIQKSGTQFGFDVGFEIALLNDDFFSRGVFIECKNYKKSKLVKSHLHDKLIEFDMSCYEKLNSIFIFLSPKVDMSKSKQDSNPKLLEDYFNREKDFKTIILTPNSRVKEILQLDESIFKRVYTGEPFILQAQHRKELILEYFRKLFFSKGVIPNFEKPINRKLFLQEASIKTFKSSYVNRTIVNREFSFFDEDLTLLDAIKKENIILLMGEPGSGKSTELKHLADYFEEKIQILKITPIFINLSSINKFNSIEDILPANWRSANKVVLLLDALDEFTFKDKLADEILKLMSIKEISIKVVVSCRTYAYNNELEKINLKEYQLQGFSKNSSYIYLRQNYGFDKSDFAKIYTKNFEEILNTPFLLSKVGEFFRVSQSLPKSPIEIFKFIEKEITKQEDIELYKVLGLVFELTRSVNVTLKELKYLFGVRHKKVIKLNLIQKAFNNKSYGFIHKNYQEYFAALAISEKSSSEIIDFISIKGINRIDPSIFNTTTFLINILDKSEKYDQIIDWFVRNEPELLFKADHSRIPSKTRTKVFQVYFENVCINKTFWITTRSNSSVSEIARFGDSNSNYKYLQNIISNTSNHFRMIISAIELYSYFKIPNGNKKAHKAFLLNQLNEKHHVEGSISIKSSIIGCIDKQELIRNDDFYLNEILTLFKDKTSNELNRSLLGLINNYENIDSLFDYVFEEFQRAHNLKPRKEDDGVSRGNKHELDRLIIRMQSSKNFLAFMKGFFNKEMNLHFDKDFTNKVIQKCIDFALNEPDFIERFLSLIHSEVGLHVHDKTLREIILKSYSKDKAIKHLISNNPIEKVGLLLAALIDSKALHLIAEIFIKKKTSNKQIERFRNYIGNINDRDLAEEFHIMMKKKGIVFQEEVYTKERAHTDQSKNDEKIQYNLDILFNKELLKFEIEKVFTSVKKTEISFDEIVEIESEWYRNNPYASIVIDSAIPLIRTLVFNKGTLKIDDIDKAISSDHFIFREIQSRLESYKRTNYKFTISKIQRENIVKWCLDISKQINFDELIILHHPNSYDITKDYLQLKSILFFHDEFEFELAQTFLSNCIEFTIIDNSSDIEKSFEIIFKKVNNKTLFDKKVIELINSKPLYGSVKSKLIGYALDNGLVKVLPKVKEYFQKNDSIYNEDKKLEKYIDITNDISLLKELCIDITNRACWSSIRILLKKELEKSFCIDKAIEYLESTESTYVPDALNILFKWNDLRALHYYSKFIDDGKSDYLKEKYFHSYLVIENYSILEILYDKIYLGNLERFGLRSAQSFYETYVSNLSKSDDGYTNTQLALNKIKIRLTRDKKELFYINLLLESSKDSYIASKSEPYDFDSALIKIEEILN